ncbi:TPA: hypothetical protein DCX16_03950, partial [bacterium]|nr:hypothetical protein [bacterium]
MEAKMKKIVGICGIIFVIMTQVVVGSEIKLTSHQLNYCGFNCVKGNSLLFISDRDGQVDIYRYDLVNNNQIENLTNDVWVEVECEETNDLSKVVYLCISPDFLEEYELKILDMDSKEKTLIDEGRIWFFCISINSDKVAYDKDNDIWVYDITTGDKTIVTNSPNSYKNSLCFLNQNEILFSEDGYIKKVNLSTSEISIIAEGIKAKASPDGTKIAYVKCDYGGCGLYLSTDNSPILIDTASEIVDFCWASSNDKIAYTKSMGIKEALVVKDIIDEEEEEIVIDNLSPFAFSLSDDGDSLYYSNLSNIFKLDLNKMEFSNLTNNDLTALNFEAKFSPNGQKIVYLGCPAQPLNQYFSIMGQDVFGLFVTDLEGSNNKLVGSGSIMPGFAEIDTFDVSDENIAYIDLPMFFNNDTERSGIWIVDLEGSNTPQRITGDFAFSLSFSYDGQRIVYSGIDDNFQESIFLIDKNGRNKRCLGEGRNAKFSYNDNRIAYINQYGKLCILDSDIPNNQIILDISPSSFVWSKNGQMIAYLEDTMKEIKIISNDNIISVYEATTEIERMVFSGDDTKIGFVTTDGCVYTIRTDGEDLTKINDGYALSMDWSCNNDIVYVQMFSYEHETEENTVTKSLSRRMEVFQNQQEEQSKKKPRSADVYLLKASLQQEGIITVYDVDGTILGTHTTIQEGINACPEGGTVSVSAGIYNEVVYINKGIALIGIGTPTITAQGLGDTNTVTFDGTVTDNALICGFIITGAPEGYSYGNGIFCSTASPAITNNIISWNSDNGIACYYSSPVIYNNIVSENDEGIYCEISSPTITNNTIVKSDDCGIVCINSSPTITNNTITENYDVGIACEGNSSPIIANNIIIESFCGIFCGENSSPTITNNTISENSGIGIYCNNSSPTIHNNVITKNGTESHEFWNGGIYATQTSNPIINYNCIWWNGPDGNNNYCGCFSGTNDISADPQFVGEGDYHLQSTSPCINKGTNTPPGGLPETDKDGNPRIVGGIVDMGAYEFQGTPPSGTITGTISYTGTKIGTLNIGLFTSMSDEPITGIEISSPAFPQTYTIGGIIPGTYYIGAFLDADNNENPSIGDPIGLFGSLSAVYYSPLQVVGTPTPIVVEPGAITSDINFELTHEIQQRLKEWTFMVYLDGDNNLEGAGIDDVNEMEEVGSDENINIIVQFDRIKGYDSSNGNWTDCRRFYITNDDDPRTINSPAVEILGEVNMAETKTLTEFIQWGYDNYPAKKYALILWNHGDGWRKRMMELRSKGIRTDGADKAVCWDDTSKGDCLYMSEVKEALAASGKKFDLIGFDACLMGMIEVAYQVRDYADVVVFSQDVEPGDGWPYHTILGDLAGTPTMTQEELGEVIVRRYSEEYEGEDEITQSAINLNKLKTWVPGTLSLFANSLEYYWDEIRENRGMTDHVYHTNYESYADLYHFATLMEGIEDENIINAANALKSEIAESVIANYASFDHPHFYGLNIYFPEDSSDNKYDDYVNLQPVDFPKDTTWDEFLVRFCKISPDTPKIASLYSVPLNQTFTVSWPSVPKADHYELAEGTSTLNFITIATTTGTSCVIPGKGEEGFYYYIVRTFIGTEFGNWSFPEDIWVGPNTAPTIELLTPGPEGTTTDKNLLISWEAYDQDDDARISIYYDDDNQGYDGILIVGGILEKDGSDTYLWDTSFLPQKTYYIYAMITDGKEAERRAPPVYSDYSGPLTITHGTKSWTLLIYLDGDNNLEGAGIDDVNEMEEVGSDENINIIVQFDRHPKYDKTNGNWSDCRRFYTTKDNDPRTINSPVVEVLGEVNMAETRTLTDFIQWGIDCYPAERYALVLWNHGGGWREKMEELENKGIKVRGANRAVCWDETSNNDCLYMSEVKEALTASGKMFDLIGFDACLMGMIEVAYQIKDYADVMVASQEVEPWDGWPYHTILGDLAGTPTMTQEELGEVIVRRYSEEYEGEDEITQSAIDLDGIPRLATTTSQLADEMISNWGNIKNIIKQIREDTKVIEESYIDLYYFASLIAGTTTLPPSIIESAEDAMSTYIDYAIIANYSNVNSTGLSIYFPETRGDKEYIEYVEDKVIDFPNDTYWDEFLGTYTNEFSKGYFTGSYTVYTVDEDNDEKYDYLIIGAEVNVFETGSYNIIGELYGNQRLISKVEDYQQFDIHGTTTISVQFGGWEIFNSKIDGPYRFKIVLKDIDTLIGTTSPYEYTDFEESKFGTVTGKIYYSGTKSGILRCFPYCPMKEEEIINQEKGFTVPFAGPGTITYSFSLNPGVYSTHGFLDVNNNKQYDIGEPFGIYGSLIAVYLVKTEWGEDINVIGIPTPINVTMGDITSGIDFELTHEIRLPPPGTISGTIIYDGQRSGTISVSAVGDKLSYEVEIPSPGSYSITVEPGVYSVSAWLDGDGDGVISPGDATGFYLESVTVLPDLEISDIDITLFDIEIEVDLWIKKYGPEEVGLGGTISWTIYYGNSSGNPAYDVAIIDMLPDGVIYASSSIPATITNKELIFNLETLPGYSSGSITLIGIVGSDLSGSTTLINIASITTTCNDTSPWNNSYSCNTHVFIEGPDLYIDKRPTTSNPFP